MNEFDSSTWSGDETENLQRLRALIAAGAKIAGGAVGGALGFIAGGPAAAFALGATGTIASEALTHVGNDLANRFLGPREAARVGGVLALTAQRIRDRLDAGDQVRSDDFFTETPERRSNADEITESILLKAQREAEEMKLPYMANLLANIAFSQDIGIELAQQLAKIVEGLTYRQICLLGAIPRIDRSKVRQESYRGSPRVDPNVLQVLYELFELERRGLIAVEDIAVISITDIDPSKLTNQGIGILLHHLMKLEKIPLPELEKVVSVLR